ncbi:MAG: radical SAM family heme chaperone HemW [Bacteroidales bacterium]|nr:radical SAM family heme chaperone HemW [Bacteroidales bacterium]
MDFGIYVHIPFCKQFCYYCDFYKSANYRFVPDFVDAVEKEIDFYQRKIDSKDNFFAFQQDSYDINVRSIYFGGGTPSSVSLTYLERIINKIRANFSFKHSSFNDLEITIEVNPEDADLSFYNELRSIGFNRLSIGIQSFNNLINKFLHRRHDTKSSIKSFENARKAGFNNISIDLIYGIPGQSLLDFEFDLDIFFHYKLEHLSAYHLSIEDNTEFGRRKKKKLITELDENFSNEFYQLLIDKMRKNSYEHYEISNFSLSGFKSQHNSSYWTGQAYLGIGPSAHSYSGQNCRRVNIASVKDYNHCLNNNLPFYETEIVDFYNQYNEFIINRLRTNEGFVLEELKKHLLSQDLVHNLRENIFLTLNKIFGIILSVIIIQSLII